MSDEASDDPRFYVLQQVVKSDSAQVTNEPLLPSDADVWMSGAKLVVPIATPLVYEIESEDQGEMGSYIRSAAPLMSKKLVSVLVDCGVDNLDLYEAVIRESATGHEYHDYWAVNILGLISALDLAPSSHTSLELSSDSSLGWLDRLILDENRIRGLLMFRLAESPRVVLVHRSIKRATLAAHLPLVAFVRPGDFSG